MAINEDLLYELDENGEQVVVKSEESNCKAYLRFTNRTSRPVDIWWRDFNGGKRHYRRLAADKYFDIDSFITHPWEFTDAATHENFAINNKPIFRAPNHVGGMMYRTNWNITVMVRSLRRTTMLSLASILPNPESARMIDLPVTLAEDVADLVTVLNSAPTRNGNSD